MTLVNQERARGFNCPEGNFAGHGGKGQKVELDCRLFQSCKKWAMCSKILGIFRHIYPADMSGSTQFRRNTFEGYQDGSGENMAGANTAAQAINAWKGSKTGHCSKLYGSPRYHFGIAFANGTAVLVLGKKNIATDKSCY